MSIVSITHISISCSLPRDTKPAHLFLYDVHLLQLQAQALFYPMRMSTEHSALLAVGVAPRRGAGGCRVDGGRDKSQGKKGPALPPLGCKPQVHLKLQTWHFTAFSFFFLCKRVNKLENSSCPPWFHNANGK